MRAGIIGLVASAALLAGNVNAALVTVEPDDFAPGTDISVAVPGVTLSVFSTPPANFGPVSSPAVLAMANLVGGYAPTGSLVFGTTHTVAGTFQSSWFSGDHQFRADFTNPTDFVSIMVGPDLATDSDPAFFQIFGAGNTLLDSLTVTPNAAVSTVTFSRGAADILYLIASNPVGVSGESFILDKLVFNDMTEVPEPTAIAIFAAGLVGLGMVRRRRKS